MTATDILEDVLVTLEHVVVANANAEGDCWENDTEHCAYWCGLGECPDEPGCPYLVAS